MDRLKSRRKNTTSPSRDFSKLPSTPIKLIADGLHSGDLERFRCVCKIWRAATQPRLNLYPVLPTNTYPDFHNHFTSTAVYVFRQRRHSSSAARNTWLATVEQSSDGTLLLIHPLTRIPIRTPNLLANYLKNPDSVQELSRSFDINYNDNSHTNHLPPPVNKNKPYKVILWPNPTVGHPGPEDDYVLLRREEKLSIKCYSTTLCRWFWPRVDNTVKAYEIAAFHDIIHWKELIWTVDQTGRLYGIEYTTKKIVTVFVANEMRQEEVNKLFLWETNLFLFRMGEWRKSLKVYQLNQMNYRWDELETLGDRILFFTPDSCFFVSGNDLPGCPANHVFVIRSTVNFRTFTYGQGGEEVVL